MPRLRKIICCKFFFLMRVIDIYEKKYLWNIFSVVAQKTTNTASELTWSTNRYRPQYLDEFQEQRIASTLSDSLCWMVSGKWMTFTSFQ